SSILLESDGAGNWKVLVQPAVPASYSTAADAAITLARKGGVTRLVVTGNLLASRTYTFGSVVSQGWQSGDIFYLSAPPHTGAMFTITVNAIAGTALATYAAALANGGAFIFNGTDFEVLIPGQSTT